MDPSVSHLGHSDVPSFAELWNPGLLLFLIVVGLLYTLAVTKWRPHFAESEPVSVKKKVYFWLALVLGYIASGTPIAYYGHHYYFSLHMLQQSILYLIMPPFFLLATPEWLLRGLLRSNWMKKAFRFLTHPVFTLFFFNFIFSVYHVPLVMDALMVHPVIHSVYNIVFLISAFLVWFPVFCPLPEYDIMSDMKRMGYIFLNGILLTPACALIIFASEPLYSMYAAVPESLLVLRTVDDQQLGGVIMKIVQEIVYGIALGYTFYRWYRFERKKEDEEEMQDNGFMLQNGNTNQA